MCYDNGMSYDCQEKKIVINKDSDITKNQENL